MIKPLFLGVAFFLFVQEGAKKGRVSNFPTFELNIKIPNRSD